MPDRPVSDRPVSRIADDLIPAWTAAGLVPLPKLEVHRQGLLHPAVSVFLVAGAGGEARTLLQRRAAGKYHSPRLWANACCTHPHWQEEPLDCGRRRLAQELGLTGVELVWRERLTYRADVGGGLIEHEEVDVFVAQSAVEPAMTPDPAEVSELRWVRLDALGAELAAAPGAFAPWLHIYLERSAGRIFDRIV